MNNPYASDNNSRTNNIKKEATLDDKHQVIRDLGKSGYLLKLIIGSGLLLIFFIWESFQIFSTKLQLTDTSLTNTASYSLGFSAVLGQLMTQLDIALIMFIIITLFRALPVISFTAIFVKSKKYHSAESMLPFMTVMQVFGIFEALLWGGLFIYDIINFIKYQIPIFSSNGIYTMIIVVLLLMMVFKAVQGVFMQFFIIYIKNYIRSGDCPKKPFTGMKLSLVMLSTLNAIVLAFTVGSIIFTQGMDLFFKTFPQLWPIYLFFFGGMFTNMCAISFLNAFRSRTRRLEYGAAPAPTAFNSRPLNTPYPNSQSTMNNPSPQNRQGFGGYQQNNQTYQNNQGFGGYQQNSQPYQNNRGFGGYQQNSQPYQNNQGLGGYQQNNQPYQNDQGFIGYGQNNSPFQDIPFSDPVNTDPYAGQPQSSGRNKPSKPFEDLFEYNNHDQ